MLALLCLTFCVGLCSAGGLTKIPPVEVYFPTSDGCYSYPGKVEMAEVTSGGAEFYLGTTYDKCLGTPKVMKTDSFGDCGKATTLNGYNSFFFDGTNCEMYKFWAAQDSAIVSIHDDTHEYYDSTMKRKVVFVAKTVIKSDSSHAELNPIVEPSIDAFSFVLQPNYTKINASMRMEGTTCLARTDVPVMYENGAIVTAPDLRSQKDGDSVTYLREKSGGADVCQGSILFLLPTLKDPNPIVLSTFPEARKKYVRNNDAFKVEVKWYSVTGQVANLVRTVITLTGDSSAVQEASISYGGAAATTLTVQPVMTNNHIETDKDCKGLTAKLILKDAQDCALIEETYTRSSVCMSNTTSLSLGSNTHPFDTCRSCGFVLETPFPVGTAKAKCTLAKYTLPIIKTADDKLTLAAAQSASASTALTKIWIGYAKENGQWKWQDGTTGINTDLFETFSEGNAAHDCAFIDMSAAAKYTITTASCSDSATTHHTICWNQVASQ